MIDQATAQKIKDTADIVEVVSDYVHLVRRGSNYMGLCPFHNERTPSFSVNKARNFCFCFSCKKGGSPVNFIMQKEGISYHDALLQLARKYGIKVEEKELTDEQREAMSRKEGMYVANEWAMNHFADNLTQTEEGRNVGLSYLYGRGVTDEAIKAFHLGYAIDRGTAFLEAARRKGFNTDVLKSVGLVGTSQQGRDYDRFRGRVIFPVLNTSGKVVAFGGRDLKGGPAKYVNSPESELYKKSNELYGIYQARNAMVREDRCYLVEGYLDVIGMWQSGIQNVVASSGTALTDGQIALIHRFTKKVTLIYDGDAAGIKASLRGIDMLLSHQLDVNVLLLPDGDDPDSFARKHTPEEFREYIKANETDIIRFKAKVMMDEVAGNPQRRVEAIRSVVQSLACIPDKIKRDVYIQECGRIMGVSEELIAAETATARIRIVEQLKKDRNRKALDADIASGRIPPQSMPPQQTDAPDADRTEPHLTQQSPTIKPTVQTQAQSVAAATQNRVVDNPLRPMEWKLIEYSIKYGFVDFCEAVDEDGNKFLLSLVEYFDIELSADNIFFSVDEYARIFNLIKEMLPQFRRDLDAFRLSLAPQSDAMRKEGYNLIASKNLSMNEIAKEEQKLEDEVELWSQSQMKEFSQGYIAKVLGSHEEDMVRFLANQALNERHQLSHIYSRERPVEVEADKIFQLAPMAVSVLKNGILDMKYKEIYEHFKQIAGKGDVEEETKTMARISAIMRARSEIAKCIGDRIINPMVRKK